MVAQIRALEKAAQASRSPSLEVSTLRSVASEDLFFLPKRETAQRSDPPSAKCVVVFPGIYGFAVMPSWQNNGCND